MNKKCSMCKKEMSIDNFYFVKNPKNRNSYFTANCKECNKLSKKINYNTSKKYLKTEKGKEVSYKKQKNYNLKYPEKRKAKNVVVLALKNNIIKKECCIVCKTINDIHAHHDDYSKPLDVLWLCRKHHNQLHESMKENKK